MAKRKTSKEILSELAAEDDGLPTRSIGVWTLQKLAILQLYLPAFSRACQPRGGCYVDGMAGPGIGRVKEAAPDAFYAWGSPLVALRTKPPLDRVVLMDDGQRNVDALRKRSTEYSSKTVVRKGDVNTDLVDLVRTEIGPAAPCFCFLDPEGPELRWETVEGLAHLPRSKRKLELMILFPLDMALLRLLPTDKPMREEDQEVVSLMFGNSAWWDVYQARLAGEIEPSAARNQYLELYRKDLKALGYQEVISRRVTAWRGQGNVPQELYHLFFATDHPVGKTIMRDVFDRPLNTNLIVSQQPELL